MTSGSLSKLEVIGCCLFWYAVSSLTSQLNKVILNGFDYPVFVGEFQFLFNIILGCATIWILRRPQFERIKSYFPSGTFPRQGLQLNKQLFKTFFPMGTFQFVGKVFSLAATSACSVATVASIRALSPLFIVLGYRIYYRVKFPLQTYFSLCPLVVGVMMIMISQYGGSDNNTSVYSQQLKAMERDPAFGGANVASFTYQLILDTIEEEHEFFKGILFAFLATAVFASGSIYAKHVLSMGNPYSVQKKTNLAKIALSSSQLNILSSADSTADLEAQYKFSEYNSSPCGLSIEKTEKASVPDKLTTLMYCSIFGLLYSIPAFITYELPSLLFSHLSNEYVTITSLSNPVTQIVAQDHTPHYLLIPWTLLIINGVSYFTQSLLAFHILGALSTVSYSIAAMLKRIVIIGVSLLMMEKTINFTGIVGLFHVTIGLYVYEKYGGRQKKKFKSNRFE